MKIGIANDLTLAIESLKSALIATPEHEIIWIAKDGVETVQRCAEETPDLILMDLIMPKMDGVEATRRIMKSTPCAILIVTASVGINSSKVFEAMGVGALDAVSTPVFGEEGNGNVRILLRKINSIGKLIGASNIQPPKTPFRVPSAKNSHTHHDCIVAIGCSTGGPQALANILSLLPADLPASIVVIQHMNQKFTSDLSGWLNSKTKLNVCLLKEGDRPRPGTVLIPSTDKHAILTPNNSIIYTDDKNQNFYHPSVDVFFHSVVQNWKGNCIGILLTGMGKDGAQGLLALRQRGWTTIAQDKSSSVVFGMPKAAIDLEAAEFILPIDSIGFTLTNLLSIQQKKTNND
ncbi:chemotaxis response regulator protein-glutamate methylesterase [Thermodesulfobacteriota bacterium]